MERYLDTALTPEERAEDLLGRMSTEEKMAQVICFWPRLTEEDEKDFRRNYPLGAGVMSMVYMRRILKREEAAEFQRKWQRKVMEAGPHHIPAICHMEGVCGATVAGAASFPCALGRGASWDPELEEKIGTLVGREEAALGIGHVFAPVLDVVRDPRNGRFAEGYGEDPTLISSMGTAYVRGVQKKTEEGLRPESVAKHFAGFHGSMGGIQSAAFQVSEEDYRETYVKPFQAAVSEAGLRGVMPCYTPVNGEPASVSGRILTDLLRDEMGFDGVAVSDYNGILNTHEQNRMFETLTDCAEAALKAGMDVEQPYVSGYDGKLAERVGQDAEASEALNRAVRRILEAKFRMGLFEHPFAEEEERLDRAFGGPEGAELSRQSALESLVLLKNNGALPLGQEPETIALIGCQGEDPRFLFGGYTHYSMAEGNLAVDHLREARERGEEPRLIPGTPIMESDEPDYLETLRTQKPGIRSLRETLEKAFPEKKILYARGYSFAGTDESGFPEAVEAAKQADTIIMMLGGKHGTRIIASMAEGTDSTDIGLPRIQEKLMAEIWKACPEKKIIGIHIDGRPASSDTADACLDALLEAFSPAEAGNEAIAETLSGAWNPSGKLSVSVPWTSGQCPIYYSVPNGSGFTQWGGIGIDRQYVDRPHEPRYPFGFGLSYTSFAYEGLRITLSEDEETMEVSFRIRNTGNRAGTEIAQVYVRDEYATMLRPNKELTGFCRVSLEPGEKKHVRLRMKTSQLAFRKGEKWILEKGGFEIMIGASSTDIRLRERIELAGTRAVDGRTRGFCMEVCAEETAQKE